MNKQLLLDYALKNVDSSTHRSTYRRSTLEDQMFELYNRRENAYIYPPASLPHDPEEALAIVRDLYKDDVSRISLVLNHFLPHDFLFYRVSKLEQEIFQAFDFFSEVVPEFNFQFSQIGKKGLDRYLALNKVLLRFGRRQWPRVGDLQPRIHRLLYDNFAKLFLQTNEYNRYWINVTREEPRKKDVWSGRKDMRQGDLVFMYQVAPTKAITDLYRLGGDPWFDPWGAWDGLWVDIERICSVPNISIADMKDDPLLSDWSVVRRSFQGIVTEAVPHSCYNRLLALIPEQFRQQHDLRPEQVAELGGSGQFTSEEQFEDKIIEPLLRNWGLRFQRQVRCKCHFGTQDINGFIDFLVSDQAGPVTLFEDKLKIINETQLQKAIDQAKSYALLIGLPSFVVASPEGLRLYRLSMNQETLVAELNVNANKKDEEAFRKQMLSIRTDLS